MKQIIILTTLAFAASSSNYGAHFSPTQSQLEMALQRAETTWGEHTEVRNISLKHLNDCRSGVDASGWSNLVERTIEINSLCTWDAELLQTVVLHEYGHMLLGSPAHSLDRRSVMYFQLRRGQKILPEDRVWVRDTMTRQRPTILIGKVEQP